MSDKKFKLYTLIGSTIFGLMVGVFMYHWVSQPVQAAPKHWKTANDYYVDKYTDTNSNGGTAVCYVTYDQSAGTPHPVSTSCVK